MIPRASHGIPFYQFATLAHYPELRHAVLTRLGGTSRGAFASLNVGHLVGDEPGAVDANHALIFRTLDIQPEHVVTARQVHGANVAVVGKPSQGTIVPATDGLISAEPGLALLLRFADCLPLLLYDPRRRAIALVHVGWRGMAAGIVPNALAALREALSCDPPDMLAALGPAIGPCCYEVGTDVAAAVEKAFGSDNGLLLEQPSGSLHLHLPAAVRWQLRQAGVQRIEESGLCTACHTDEFFSHRAEQGHTGRFAVMLTLRGSEPQRRD